MHWQLPVGPGDAGGAVQAARTWIGQGAPFDDQGLFKSNNLMTGQRAMPIAPSAKLF